MQERTLASVIHDIKSPVATISNYNKIAGKMNQKASGEEPDRLEACYGTIDKNCQLLQHIIEELLDLTKIENKAEHIARELIDVSAVARDCAQMLTPKSRNTT